MLHVCLILRFLLRLAKFDMSSDTPAQCFMRHQKREGIMYSFSSEVSKITRTGRTIVFKNKGKTSIHLFLPTFSPLSSPYEIQIFPDFPLGWGKRPIVLSDSSTYIVLSREQQKVESAIWWPKYRFFSSPFF